MMQMQEYEKQHIKRLRKYLAECTVLLKSNGDFPVKKAGKIAAYGSGVRGTIKGGTGSGEVNSRYYTTIERGLDRCGFEVTTGIWLDAYDRAVEEGKIQFKKDVKAKAKEEHGNPLLAGMGAIMLPPEYELPLIGEGDVAIYVVSRISGEGTDRQPIAGDVKLTESEIRDILLCQEKYEKFMLVLNVGGPIDLSPVVEKVENILVLSQLGVETGLALGGILIGAFSPSGKLATTWSAWEDYPQIGEFGEKDDTRYKEGIYVGYRYFDSVGKKALFPFGYGTSFTSFDVSKESVEVDGEKVAVCYKVKNTGNYKGKEVLQVYVSVPAGKLDQPYQVLAGFAKTKELLPGEETDVTISFQLSDLASYDEREAKYILEAGDYILRVGTSSVDTEVAAVLELQETVTVRKVKNVLGRPDFVDYVPEKMECKEALEDICRFVIDETAIATERIEYDKEYEIDPITKVLTDEQLMYMNIGGFDPKKSGIASVIGNASMKVAGAAGETTSMCMEEGIEPIVMADGPAGIRISKRYVIRDGKVMGLGSSLPETILETLPKPIGMVMNLMATKPKRDEEIQYQYCTAIPIGTALAQSFNVEFAKECGDIVGTEMERFGVQLWLAPALNIHRSILCGRNFEYYSEDPLVSGKMAAAVTLGVQAHKGCGTTIKHYAANNQETNRYANNSMVSERAMREIYLKGFEICVKESQPLALMTSYNLLNGTHTSEHRGLNEDILRSEFGYEGVVMTDWVVAGGLMNQGSKYEEPHPALVAASGNDLFMPGGKGDFKEMKEGLSTGMVLRRQLQVNATRVIELGRKL